MPGPHRGVWNEAALASSKEIILCESLIDALTFWCAGFRNVTAAYGVEGFTDDHRAAFRKHGTERVLIAYDRDAAGDAAAAKLAAELAGMGIEVMRVVFPRGMDANEYALKVQPAAQSLGLVLRQATWMAGVRRNSESQAAVEATLAPPASEAAMELAAAAQPEAIPFLAAEPASTEAISAEAEQASARVAEPTNEPAREEAASAMETVATASLPLETPPAPMSLPAAAAPPPRHMTAREVSQLADELGADVQTTRATSARPAPSRSPHTRISRGEFHLRARCVARPPGKPPPGSLA